MAPLPQLLSSGKLPLSSVLVLLVLFASILVAPSIASENLQLGGRRLLEEDDGDVAEAVAELPKKKPSKLIVGGSSSSSAAAASKNKTKLLKPLNPLSSSGSLKNQTRLIKPTSSISTKNQTKLLKPITGAGSAKNKTKVTKSLTDDDDLVDTTTKVETVGLTKTKIKKLNSTSSTKPSSILSKKSSDLIKTAVGGAKNKTTKSSSGTKSTALDKVSGAQLKPDKETNPKTKTGKTTQMTTNPISSSGTTTTTNPTSKNKNSSSSSKKQQALQKPNWMYESDDDDDLVSEIKDLPSRLQQSFVPDLHRISTNSKIYLTKANKDLAKGFKPYVGNRYAPTMATALSCAFILIPLVLVSLIINRFKAYFSIQKLVIFVQVYLAIYFSILCLSSLVTGLEPLRFFYATSQPTYICLQVIQTLGYIMYLLLLLMYLVLVFSSPETGLGSRFLGLGQTFVGFAVGLHYYVTVFHRVVLRQPPRTNWKVHGVYATCFIVVCLFATADRRKKAYLEDGGQEGKKN